MKNFFFIRHGQIAEEYKKVFYGQLDVPLSKEGELLSKEVVKELSSIPLKAIFSSPLKRALFPAKLLAKKKGIPLYIRDELKEIDYGEWTGKPRDLIYKEALFWERLKKDFLAPPKGESIRDLRNRAKSFWEYLSERDSGNYVIFTHGGFIRALICEILNLSSEHFFAFEVYHLKVNYITLYEDGLYVFKGINLKPSQLKLLLTASYW